MENQEISKKTYYEAPGFTHVTNEDILKHLGLVYKIVYEEYFGDELNFDEKVTEGMLGVAKALETFDPSRGVTKAHWVGFNVKKSIRDETRRSYRQRRYARSKESQELLYQNYEQQKRIPELALMLRDMDEEKKRTGVSELMEFLTDDERYCVQRLVYDSLTQEELARELGVSQSWVSRVWRRALQKMKENSGELAKIYNLV